MITLPTSYSNSLKRPHKENWLFRLYNNTGSYIGIALDDVTDDAGDFYRGVITNKPSIREKINLHNSTSSVSNISITIANFNYTGNDFSRELVFGTNYYINQDVKVYSRVNDSLGAIFSQIDEEFDSYDITFQNASDDKLLIYTGRLESVSHDHNTITLNIVAKRPWDDISIPNTLTTNRNIHIPVSYGNFTKNTNSTYSSPQLITDLTATTYRPVPLNEAESGGGTYGYVIGADNITADCEPAFWDKDLEKFLPLSSATAASVLKNGAYHTKGSLALYRGFKFRPVADDDVSNGGILNPGNAYDTSTTSYANRSTGSTITYEHKFHYGGFTGEMNQASTDIVWEIVITMDTGIVGNAKIHYKFDSDGSYTQIANESTVGTHTGTQSVSSKPNKVDDHLTIKFEVTAGTGDWNADIRIKDLLTTFEAKHGDDQHRIGYTGADGLDKSYSSGTATKIHEAARDILHRYTSLSLTSDPTGWSALDTARSSWTLRYWLNEPKLLKDVLNKLSYEGSFIYRMRQDDTLQFIHVPNTPSNDHTVTKDDISNFNISHTPFSNLITKSEYEYDKHPAENRYISTATVTNSTTRTNYNISTEDNVKKIRLDALVAAVSGGTGMNASHANYYNELNGEVRVLMSCDIVNPQIAASMEVGDIVYISDMPVSAFNTAFPEQFILTSLKKSPGRTSIELFQVGDTSSKGGPS